jgi:hypothetical protein
VIDRHEDARPEPERHLTEVEKALSAHSDSLREALPDRSLRLIYDRWVEAANSPHGPFGVSADVLTLLRKLRITTEWLDPHPGPPSRPFQDSGIEPGAAEVVWRDGTPEERTELLRNIQALAERRYEAARKRIQDQWAEATRTGGQPELLERWRALLLRYVVQAGGANLGTVAPARSAAPPRRLAPSATRSQAPSAPVVVPAPVVAPAPAVKKTWIEFRLVDEDGKPVGHVRYELELPDGSTKSGVLDEQGRARFEDLDPGKCQIAFPDIDAREWRRA